MLKKYFGSGKARAIFSECKSACFQYLKAQFILFGINTLVITAGLLLLGMKWWAFPIALGTAFVDLLPVLGAGIVFVPWSVYCFYNHDNPMGAWLLVLFAVLIVLKLILEPLICGKKIGLSGAESFAAIVAGFFLLGGSGILLGPLLAVVIKIVLKHVGNTPENPPVDFS